MSVKHVKEHYLKVVKQYIDMQQELREFDEEAAKGLFDPDRLDSIKELPKLYLIIEGKKLLIDRDILFSHHKPLCNLRIREHLHSNQWEIGTSFLHYFISVFDYENRTITFYYQNKDNDNCVLYILIGLILFLLSYTIYLTIFIVFFK